MEIDEGYEWISHAAKLNFMSPKRTISLLLLRAAAKRSDVGEGEENVKDE